MIEQATPVQIRKSLEAVEIMKKTGLRFVPMPALNEADHVGLVAEMTKRLERLISES